ncbi:MAG: nucleotide exchange factor GrpE [Rhodospirillaceae bacterium]|jgi:molecular chaperone GrpE|nr:nucleotide exchange factor GrpE [Rhodospirillaceae bacterium]MBT3884977.1 nucleotide exchange factor GrpE [Rhodospirillaceae bacterium]MBT4118267.1 nucleotide exchange factor GrpE [Rhodospirillaceae bacterium]MBT4673110.1 nucleotide exchange factor GrpE [Rhodospirillaceae bacterium]MBT4721931.1 nucleotide exchange factor GrpE [Rhodospirillaceae bacterium]
MTDDQDQNPEGADEPTDQTEGENATEDEGENDPETTFDFGADPDADDAAANDAAAAAAAVADDGMQTYEELQASAAELKDQLLRALADTENTRRRAEREKADTAKYATANMARAVLGVADNLSRALTSVSAEAKAADEDLNNLCVGIELTETEMVNAFEHFGITPIEAMGKKFDHNFHQAMFEIEDVDQPAGTVVQEVQRGYVIHERLLRPSMVGVTKGGPKVAAAPVSAPAEVSEETASEAEESSSSPASAYEKQSDAADREADNPEPHVDRKL